MDRHIMETYLTPTVALREEEEPNVKFQPADAFLIYMGI
jgi:hypothetical protein